MKHVAHWDDVFGTVRGVGDIGARWTPLGEAAATVGVGLRRIQVENGRRSTAVHVHGAEEEILVVLDVSGTLRLGDGEAPVRRGHVIARPPGTDIPHSFRAGEAGLDLLAHGTREPNDIACYPRSGKASFRGIRLGARIERLACRDGED